MVHFNLASEKFFKRDMHSNGFAKALTVINDGNEFFLANVCRYPNNAYKDKYDYSKALEIIKSYLKNNGIFVCYYGPENPFELLKKMIEWNDSFSTHPGCCLEITKSNTGGDRYVVHGNLEVVSSVFHYVFFCKESLDYWISKAKLIDPNSNFDY